MSANGQLASLAEERHGQCFLLHGNDPALILRRTIITFGAALALSRDSVALGLRAVLGEVGTIFLSLDTCADLAGARSPAGGERSENHASFKDALTLRAVAAARIQCQVRVGALQRGALTVVALGLRAGGQDGQGKEQTRDSYVEQVHLPLQFEIFTEGYTIVSQVNRDINLSL